VIGKKDAYHLEGFPNQPRVLINARSRIYRFAIWSRGVRNLPREREHNPDGVEGDGKEVAKKVIE
jgi:hypothetical protein